METLVERLGPERRGTSSPVESPIKGATATWKSSSWSATSSTTAALKKNASLSSLHLEQDVHGGILGPYGNRGADLIITCKLDELTHFSRGAPHPSIDPATGSPKRVPPDQWPKPWRKPKVQGGTVQLHSPERARKLLPTLSRSFDALPRVGTGSSASPDVQLPIISRKDAAREQAARKQERTLRRMKELQRAKAERAEREYQELAARIESEESRFVAKVSEYIHLRDEEERRKTLALHRSWEDAIYKPIQEQVGMQVDQRVAQGDIGKRWRDASTDFQQAYARKEGGLFRDIIIESEYDPLLYAKQAVKYRSAHLRDPIKLDANKAMDELRSIPGAKLPSSTKRIESDRLHPTIWGDRLGSTPYGHFAKFMNSKGNPLAEKYRRSNIRFDDFGE